MIVLGHWLPYNKPGYFSGLEKFISSLKISIKDVTKFKYDNSIYCHQKKRRRVNGHSSKDFLT